MRSILLYSLIILLYIIFCINVVQCRILNLDNEEVELVIKLLNSSYENTVFKDEEVFNRMSNYVKQYKCLEIDEIILIMMFSSFEDEQYKYIISLLEPSNIQERKQVLKTYIQISDLGKSDQCGPLVYPNSYEIYKLFTLSGRFLCKISPPTKSENKEFCNVVNGFWDDSIKYFSENGLSPCKVHKKHEF